MLFAGNKKKKKKNAEEMPCRVSVILMLADETGNMPFFAESFYMTWINLIFKDFFPTH